DAAGAALTPYGEAVAMRLHKPRFPDEDRPDSPFGIHVLATEKQTTMAHALGFKWVRIHDASPHITKWYAVEPQRGQWHWSDDQADIYRQHHLMILGTLDTSPRWASRADPKIETDPKRMEKYVPKDMDAWSEYCRETTAHYKGTIDAWEIWNEPYGFGFYRDVVNGQVVHATPEQFAEVAKRAYEAAHQSNPNCVVMTSVGSVPTWTEGCARSGAVNFADFFTHHQYVMQLPGGPNDTIARNMAMWRAGLPENLRDKTSWDTEGGAGVNAHTFYSHIPIGEARRDARYFADHSARYYISCLANGVPKFFLYSFHSHGGLGNASFSSIDGDGTLQPLAAAVSALAWHIEGKRFVRMAPLSGTTWAYLFTDGKESVAAIVNAPGKTCALPKIDGAECRDLLGSPIALPAAVGPETSYITSKAAPDALLKGLEAKSL
ncbi:MAG: hypothetical protein NTW86_17585, partial [Candidatus Sumerlaeota bacterium]|nr:hypothetical protein [Candidatus Sumerlaeota bacterium]